MIAGDHRICFIGDSFVQVGVEVGSTAKALDEGDGAGGGLLAFDARFFDEMAVDGAALLDSGWFETLSFPHALL